MGDRDFKVGLLGHGTVGAAFEVLLAERAEEIERFNGRRPVLSGVLTRSRGSFDEILAGSDLLVELIGGLEPAREYLLAGDARRQARGHRQQAAALPARRGALRDGPRAGCEAALRGGRGRRGAGREGARGIALGDPDRAHPRDRQRHDELHPHRDEPGLQLRRGAGGGAAQRLRRGRSQRRRVRPRRSRQDGDPRATRLRHPGASRRGALRGHRAPAQRRPAVRQGAGPGPEAGRHGRAAPGRSVGVRVSDLPVFRASAGRDLGLLQRRHRGVRDRSPRSRCRGRAPAAVRPPARCWETSSA